MSKLQQFDQKFKETVATVLSAALLGPKQCTEEGDQRDSSPQRRIDAEMQLWTEM
jgi:hypothetical protein